MSRRRSRQTPEPAGWRLRSAAVFVDHGVGAFEFAVGCEVFGTDRRDDGVPLVDFRICGPTPGSYRAQPGFTIGVEHGLDTLATTDLIIIPALGLDYVPSPAFTDALRAAVARGARVISLCTGAFALARTGLLDGRRAATHWRHEAAFAAAFPQVELVRGVLFVADPPLMTSAGTAAAIDLCLHVVREAHGPHAAVAIGRRMVVPPQRDGGQAQFVQTPLRAVQASTLAPVLDWASRHLDTDLSVAVLARQAAMSERTFARRFRDETGTTPHQWVLTQRLALAERLLERGDMSIESVAQASGFGSATMLRHHFGRARGVTPTSYRRAFGIVTDGAGTGGSGSRPSSSGPTPTTHRSAS